MPSLLDTLLNTRVNNRIQARQDAIDGFRNSRVTAFGDRGIQISQPDNRASSQLARGVANRLLGHTPQSMTTMVDPNNNIYFRDGSNTANQLRESGIGVGSSLADLRKAMDSLIKNPISNVDIRNSGDRQNNTLGVDDIGNAVTGLGSDVTVPTRRGNAQNGVGMDGGVTQANATQTNAAEGFQNGYQNGQAQNEQDFNQLNLHVNRASEEFQRLLHSSLFSN